MTAGTLEDSLQVVQLPALSDNYITLIHHMPSGETAVVDPAVADIPLQAANDRGWTIRYILNTHWHPDHVGGNLDIKAATGAKILAPKGDQDKIPGIDQAVGEGFLLHLGERPLKVLETPGHTIGHIVWLAYEDHLLFAGDTLFSLGCGRLFEGTAEQMFNSLKKIKSLPDRTMVYCAHEYSESNARFAANVDPDNPALAERIAEIQKLGKEGAPTIPFSLGLDKQANPFLLAKDIAQFAKYREQKDQF